MTATTQIRRTRGLAVLAAVCVAGLIAAGPSLASRASAPHSGQPVGTGSPGSSGPQGKAKSKPVTTPTPGHGAPANGSADGIVQSVDGGAVVLTQLDGSSVTLSVFAGTRVFVDGRRASIGDVRPGSVASATWTAGKLHVLQAFDSAVEVGAVRSVSGREIVVTRGDGGTVRLRVGPKTRVLLDGGPATLSSVKAGFVVVFAARDAKTGKPAGELRFLRPV
jgi:hypothetical protein